MDACSFLNSIPHQGKKTQTVVCVIKILDPQNFTPIEEPQALVPVQSNLQEFKYAITMT